MSIYADTSFFVSLYIQDRYSEEVCGRMAAKPDIWLTPLHIAEWTHAVGQHVFQKKMSPQEAQKVHADFAHDRAQGLWIEVGVPDAAFDVCAQLGRSYAARLGNRTLDALHVAVARELKAQQFWTFDERRSKLARTVGLRVR